MNGYRDRATGWKHAKLSGHKNEDMVKDLLDTDLEYANDFLNRMGYVDNEIISTSVGGLHETNVPSVIGTRKTKSKTDLKFFLDNERVVNVSVKKSLSGQVYIVSAQNFIEIFEKQFECIIPESVKRAINLFWSGTLDTVNIIEEFADRSNKNNFELQIRHRSLNATTLKAYNRQLYDDMLMWFTDNAYEITKLCFAMGAVRDKSEWSDYIWHINMFGENDVDAIFSIEDICVAAALVAEEKTNYGTVNGGTTIQLPFGFVEWHHCQLQFHHNYDKIIDLFE